MSMQYQNIARFYRPTEIAEKLLPHMQRFNRSKKIRRQKSLCLCLALLSEILKEKTVIAIHRLGYSKNPMTSQVGEIKKAISKYMFNRILYVYTSYR